MHSYYAPKVFYDYSTINQKIYFLIEVKLLLFLFNQKVCISDKRNLEKSFIHIFILMETFGIQIPISVVVTCNYHLKKFIFNRNTTYLLG